MAPSAVRTDGATTTPVTSVPVSNGGEFDSGPPLFGSLPGDHNRDGGGSGRERAASPPLPTTAAQAPAPAGGSSAGGAVGEEEVVVVEEGGRIGGLEAGSLDRIPVVRLPPPPATPLSDALAKKRLADLDGLGRSPRGEKKEEKEEVVVDGGQGRSKDRASGGGGDGRNRGHGRRSSHPPMDELVGGDDDDDNWANVNSAGMITRGREDKARKKHWLSTAASRRGDGRFASFGDGSGGGGGGARPVPPSTAGNGTGRNNPHPAAAAAEDHSADAGGSGRAGAGGAAAAAGSNSAMSVARAGRVLGHAGHGAAGGNGTGGRSDGGGGSGHAAASSVGSDAYSSLAAAATADRQPGGGGGGGGGGGAAAARGRRPGGGSFSKVVDESDLAVLSSDDGSADTNSTVNTNEGGSDRYFDLNDDRRLTGGRSVSWEDPSSHVDRSSFEDDTGDGQWGGGRSDGDRELEERRRGMMAVSVLYLGGRGWINRETPLDSKRGDGNLLYLLQVIPCMCGGLFCCWRWSKYAMFDSKYLSCDRFRSKPPPALSWNRHLSCLRRVLCLPWPRPPARRCLLHLVRDRTVRPEKEREKRFGHRRVPLLLRIEALFSRRGSLISPTQV